MSQGKLSSDSVQKGARSLVAGCALVGAGWIGSHYLQNPPTPRITGAGGEVRIQVSGAVKKPGVYALRKGDRVEDAIRAAGGVASGADLNGVNQSAYVVDAQPLRVPMIGEPAEGPYSLSAAATTAPAALSSAPSAPVAGKVSLNSASQAELESLPRVGPALAQRIMQYRAQNGGFKSIDELDNVKGIGEKTMALLRPFLSL